MYLRIYFIHLKKLNFLYLTIRNKDELSLLMLHKNIRSVYVIFLRDNIESFICLITVKDKK